MRQRASAVIIKDGKILLIRRRHNGVEYLVYPGGGIEEGEAPIDALRREVSEELGLEIKSSPEPLFELMNKGQKEFFFLVKDFSGKERMGGPEAIRMNENNSYELEWLPVVGLPSFANLYPAEAAHKLLNEGFCDSANK
jgi:8-oxo-dGTP diphosphatase